MYHRSTLPLKVATMIVDMLDEDTLRACLFVSKSFRHHARTHLFKSIRIDDVGTQFRTQRSTSMESVHRRLQLLVDLMCPSIADQGILPYIREVQFTFSKCGSLYSSCSLTNSQYQCRPSLRYLLEILRLLNAPKCWVRSLQVDGSGDMGYGSWSALEPAIRCSLVDLCHSPTLSTLHLHYMTDVPENLLKGTSVVNVISYGVSFSAETRLFDEPQPLICV